MKKLTVLLMVLLITLVAIPATAVADEPYVTISVAGEGTWDGGNLSVSMFPGEEKCFQVTVYNLVSVQMQASVHATPSCDTVDVSACCFPSVGTLVADGNITFEMRVTASGATPPGEYSINLTVETTVEPIVPDSTIGVPHHMTLTSLYSNRTAGALHELTATVFDVGNSPVVGVVVQWTVPTGNATISSADTVTDANGRAGAMVRSVMLGISTVRCQVASNAAIFSAVSLTWVAAPVDDDDDEEPPVGLPAWVVFIIGVAIIGGVFGGYFYLKHRQEKKKFFSDPLTRPGKQDPLDLSELDKK